MCPGLCVKSSGGRACMAARDEKGGMHLHLIDLAADRIARSIDQPPAAIRGLGFASDDLLYTADGRSVRTVEIATGKTRHTVKVGGGVLMGSHKVGDRLYLRE